MRPSPPIAHRSRLVIAGRALIGAMALLAASPGRPASFTIPQVCNGFASGSEDNLDPVVIINRNAGNTPVRGFLVQADPNQPWNWFVNLVNPPADNYGVTVTYTPFLASTGNIDVPNRPAVRINLPQADYLNGRDGPIYARYGLTVYNANNQLLPNAIVDFIPNFRGSSPYTLTADHNGQILIACIKYIPAGYRVTVYDPNGNYLYDSSFQVLQQGHDAIRPGNGRAAAETDDEADAGPLPPKARK